jgi:hypothetical protein
MFRRYVKIQFVALASILLVGCTTQYVQTEFSKVNDAFETAKADIDPKLKKGLEIDRQAEITAAAVNGDVWTLSEDCYFQISTADYLPSDSCAIEKIAFGDRPSYVGSATALKRKLDVISIYLTALAALSEAKLETELSSAYDLALSAFSDLSKTAELSELAAFLSDRQKEREDTKTVAEASIRALRYQMMRSVVLNSDRNVRQVVKEAIAIILNDPALGIDTQLKNDLNKLRTADAELLEVDRSDSVVYRAKLVALEKTHSDFTTAYKKTTTYKLVAIADLHGKLATALRSGGSVADTVAYLKSLKVLYNLLEKSDD